jgi:hypothetical protein
MKKLFITILLFAIAASMSAFISPTNINLGQTGAAQTASLNDDEVAGLIFMREEEKLAHDLYAAFYEMYGLRAFQNIAGSEITHTSAIKSLLDSYGIPDPAAGAEAGVFSDPALQDLYNQLLAQGSLSLSDALKVSAAVEEIDILDLQARIEQTDQADIILVYENLEAGSENHLRAYTSLLQFHSGETYVPGHLSADEYQRILSGTSGSGLRSGQGGQGGRGAGGPRRS